MRTSGIWHAGLVELLVALRHHETIVVADAGLPVPNHVPTIDLGWSRGNPRLLPVLTAIAAELVIESATIASEATDDELLSGVDAALQDVPIKRVTHEALKEACAGARAVVRTGDDTPFANVILHAGVPFGAAS
jgi:D-ribose pyranase